MKRLCFTQLNFLLLLLVFPFGLRAQESATAEALWGASAESLTMSGTLIQAFEAVRANGSSVKYVKLQKDVATNDSHNITGGVFTLDLNGNTLSNMTDLYSTLSVRNNNTSVTIVDESSLGKITTDNSNAAVEVAYGATVTFEGGLYEGASSALNIAAGQSGLYSPGKAIIKGGTFNVTDAGTPINNSGNLIIDDGVFKGPSLYSVTVFVSQYAVSTIINGGNFEQGFYGTIQYAGGFLDLSQNPTSNFENFTVYNLVDNLVPGTTTIKLPEGYCFYDNNDDIVSQLSSYRSYSIDEEREVFLINYLANGGVGEMEDATCYGSHILPECSFTAPEGKMFKAWSVDGIEYDPGEIITVSANTTVTAIWEVPYVVSFVSNGGSGNMDDIKTLTTFTLPECSFTAPEGKMFKAWSVNGIECDPGENFVVFENMEVKAIWTDYIPLLTINLQDSYGDGWYGDAVIIMKDDVKIDSVTIEDGSELSKTYDYDSASEYRFYWVKSGENEYPEECSFEIVVENDTVYVASETDCEGFTNRQLVYSIDADMIVIEELIINDGELEEFNSKYSSVGELTYTRKLSGLTWNALYVPFEIPVMEIEDNYDVAYINDVHSYDADDNGEIDYMEMEIIKIREGVLKANHPYLIRAKNNAAKDVNITLTDATLYKTDDANKTTITCSSAYMDFKIEGTYVQMTSDELEDVYAISTEGSWQKLLDGTTLNPFRLCMSINKRDGSPVKIGAEAEAHIRIKVKGEDNLTGIEKTSVSDGVNSTKEIYDLLGRRVVTPYKGMIYIIDGKKRVY